MTLTEATPNEAAAPVVSKSSAKRKAAYLRNARAREKRVVKDGGRRLNLLLSAADTKNLKYLMDQHLILHGEQLVCLGPGGKPTAAHTVISFALQFAARNAAKGIVR